MCGLVVLPVIHGDKVVEESLRSIVHRGPDSVGHRKLANWHFAFARLAIMDLTSEGDQPFEDPHALLVCNGEIYNQRELRQQLDDYPYHSKSDCEVILPLVQKMGIKAAANSLDGEFAFCYYDKQSSQLLAARDAMGIRPLFYGYDSKGEICFASEVKALKEVCSEVIAFPPGHVYCEGEFISFCDLTEVQNYRVEGPETIATNIRELLTQGVLKRLSADAPVGFLLSGGLDSSLVCAIAAKHLNRPIVTFSVGMAKDAIDLKYARQVADFIGSEHHEVIITEEQVISELGDVVAHLETWDITTIRASIGMYHVCKYIREKTDIKVVLTGEVADEIFGYKYTDFAPDEWEFQKEAQKRVKEIYMYDVLRADRSIAAHSLEARVPFSDREFVEYVMSLHPKLKMNTTGQGKYLLRKAFEQGDYLPKSILWREKAAFSDAVGHSLADCLKAYAQLSYSDKEFEHRSQQYQHARPFTKESLLYRDIFEKLFSGQAKLVADFWMPNKKWENCDVDDPSARVLPNYGASGV